MVNYHPQNGYRSIPRCSSTIHRIVTHLPRDGHPPTTRCSPNIHRMVMTAPHHPHREKNGQPPTQDVHIPRMFTHHLQDGHHPSPGWSPTISRMVTHHLHDCHPPSKIYKKDVYYRFRIWYLELAYKIKHGHPPFLGWSLIITRMVTHYPKYSHPSSKIGPPTFPRIITQ